MISWVPSGNPLNVALLFDAYGNPVSSTGGALDVYITGGGGGGGTSAVDETTFTAGESAGTPIMGEDPTSGDLLIVSLAAGTRSLSVAGSLAVTPAASTTASGPSLVSVGATSTLGIAANAARLQLNMQNIGTQTIFVLYGGGVASNTNFHQILPSGGASKDGSSPLIITTLWKGAIQIYCPGGSGQVSIWENT